MTRREEILEKAKTVIVESLPELEGQAFDENTVINTDTGIDSMGFTLIICRLEAAFDVRIPNRQWQKLSTLGGRGGRHREADAQGMSVYEKSYRLLSSDVDLNGHMNNTRYLEIGCRRTCGPGPSGRCGRNSAAKRSWVRP